MKKFLRRNSSTILTCVGAVGVVATSVMAVKATPKALTLIDAATEEKGEKLTKFEVVKVAGPAYIPAIITGAATIACIMGSNVISRHQQASLMSAYALLDSQYKEYREKVDEIYGDEAGKKVRGEIVKDKYTGDDLSLEDDKDLFYDFFSGRYFKSTMEQVLRAEYEVNRALYVNYSVGVNEFYEALGLEPMPEFENIGWSCGQIEEMYWHNWIEFDHEETVLDEDADGNAGLVCTIVNMPLPPYIDYEYY